MKDYMATIIRRDDSRPSGWQDVWKEHYLTLKLADIALQKELKKHINCLGLVERKNPSGRWKQLREYVHLSHGEIQRHK